MICVPTSSKNWSSVRSSGCVFWSASREWYCQITSGICATPVLKPNIPSVFDEHCSWVYLYWDWYHQTNSPEGSDIARSLRGFRWNLLNHVKKVNWIIYTSIVGTLLEYRKSCPYGKYSRNCNCCPVSPFIVGSILCSCQPLGLCKYLCARRKVGKCCIAKSKKLRYPPTPTHMQKKRWYDQVLRYFVIPFTKRVACTKLNLGMTKL